MASKAQIVNPATAKRPRKRARRRLNMLMVKGDPIQALKEYRLPPGARVAIVSFGPKTIRKISVLLGKRGYATTEVTIADPSDVKQAAAPRQAVIDKMAFEPDARSRALLAGVRIAQEDIREAGGAYDLEQVRTLMRGVSRQAVDKRVQEGSLLAVPGPSNRRSYPTLQFTRDGAVVPGLKAVRDALQTSNPWTVLNFLARPDNRLSNRKPIDLLKSGNLDLVIEAARRHGEQGA